MEQVEPGSDKEHVVSRDAEVESLCKLAITDETSFVVILQTLRESNPESFPHNSLKSLLTWAQSSILLEHVVMN